MRKFITAVACVFGLTAVQLHDASAQTIGFKVGPTFSNIDFDPDLGDNSERLTSFGGGGFFRFGLAGLSLQLEALAITKGQKAEFSDPDMGDATSKVKMTYVEVPLTVGFALGSGPYIFGGPTVAVEVGCDVQFEMNGSEVSGDCDEQSDTVEGEFMRKKTDFGVTAGAGIQFPMGPGSLLLEGRHTWGLTNLNDDPAAPDQKMRHRSIAVFAGYAIPIGR